MKILMISPRKGGPQKWARDLSSCLRNEGLEVEHTFGLAGPLRKVLEGRYDLIHSSAPITAPLWKKPSVLTIKGDYRDERVYMRPFWKYAQKKADAVTVPSKFLMNLLGVEAKVIPNAIDSEGIAPVKHSEKMKPKAVNLSSFMFKEKAEGSRELAEVFSSKKNGKLELLIAGGGPYERNVRGACDGVHAKFMGFARDSIELLKGCDIFVYNSGKDNFPNAILEAMAVGLPIVTNGVGAVGEMIDDGVEGYICDSAGGIYEKTAKLASDARLRAKIGKLARKRVERDFDWKCVVKSYVKLYGSLLK